MNLHAELELRRGGLDLRVDLAVAAGETVALLGPNGAGKTTCLLAIAGLLRLDGGRIALGDRVLDGGPGGAFVPPEARGAGVVFQDHFLLPHLSVLDNVAYGPRSRGRGRRAARTEAAQRLAAAGLEPDLHGLRPGALSGGQAQRAALARALASAPSVLLLDEPFAAVDASARLQLRRDLAAQLRRFDGPRIVVTHDVTDAQALADRVVVLERGRVAQQGAFADLVARPQSRYVADLVGVNCFLGTCRGGIVAIGGFELRAATALEGEVVVTLHPRAIALFGDRPQGSPRNVWRAPIDAVEPVLDRVRVCVGGALPLVAEVTAAAVRDLGLAPGREVWVAIKATELQVAAR